jgi:predicted dehydrogenase
MSIHFSTDWPYPKTEIALVGTKGGITFRVTDTMASELTLFKSTGVEVESAEYSDSIEPEMEAWVKSCLGGTIQPNLTPREASGVLDLCLAWKRSADKHEVVPMESKK